MIRLAQVPVFAVFTTAGYGPPLTSAGHAAAAEQVQAIPVRLVR